MSAPVYSLSDVGLVYPSRSGAVAALKEVSLKIAHRERVAFLGASGAGKSTLLRLLNATLRPSRGSVLFEERGLAALGPRELRQVRRRIGTVFQQPQLVPSLTALQNTLCGRLGSFSLLGSLRALLTPRAGDARAALSALEKVGLSRKAAVRADELSGGQQQRIAIARVLLQDPEVVLADEPFASLDPVLTTSLAELLFGVAAEQRTLVVAMHDVELALRHFPRIVGIRAGRVLFDARAKDVTPRMLEELYAQERRPAERTG